MKIPLSLSVYEHAARFVGRSPWEVSRDGELLFSAHQAAYEVYRHAPVVVGIDIYNLEAEAYGCRVERPDGNGIPAVTEHPCREAADVLRLTPLEPAAGGRIPMVVEAAARMKRASPGTDVRVPLSGPFSIAASLLGLDALLTEVALAPDAVREGLFRLVEGQVAFARFVKAAGLDVAFFESAAAPPLLSPDQFRAVELPPLKRALRAVERIVGHAVPCIIGGDTAPITPAMLETGTNFLICPSETDQEAFVEAMRAHPEVAVRVNLDPRVYSRGTREEIARAVDAVLALARRARPVLLGTGAIPYETPPENILFIREYVA
ncbi:MAG: uroporphyrinogen decarboxylase family protein [Planctomycetota bacterium]